MFNHHVKDKPRVWKFVGIRWHDGCGVPIFDGPPIDDRNKFDVIEKFAYDDLKTENEFLREFDIGLAKQNHIMRKALESISKNSCCGSCQEAKLVALRALGDPTETTKAEE